MLVLDSIYNAWSTIVGMLNCIRPRKLNHIVSPNISTLQAQQRGVRCVEVAALRQFRRGSAGHRGEIAGAPVRPERREFGAACRTADGTRRRGTPGRGGSDAFHRGPLNETPSDRRLRAATVIGFRFCRLFHPVLRGLRSCGVASID